MKPDNRISIKISIGELYDRVAILLVKQKAFEDKGDSLKLRLTNVELDELMPILVAFREILKEDCLKPKRRKEEELFKKMISINQKIWEQIDGMTKLARKDSGDKDGLGIQIFKTNNERYETKKEIDKLYGFTTTEQKGCI